MMIRLLSAVTIVVLWGITSPANASPLTQSAVMLYKSERLIGSGVVVDYKGTPHVLTCAHVADAFEESRAVEEISPDGSRALTVTLSYAPVKLVTRKGRVLSTRTGRIVKTAKAHKPDLALIKPDDDKGLNPVPLLPSPAKIGEPVWYCGAGNGTPFNLVRSIVNDTDDDGFLRFGGEGWYGHSGSGVLVRRKKAYYLAGVLWGVKLVGDAHKRPILAENHKTLAEFLK